MRNSEKVIVLKNSPIADDVLQEAAYEAVGREMRRVINFRSDMFNKEKEVAERLERRESEETARRMERRARAAQRRANQQAFQLWNFGTLALLALLCIACVNELMSYDLCVSLMFSAAGLLVCNFLGYFIQSQKTWDADEEEYAEWEPYGC